MDVEVEMRYKGGARLLLQPHHLLHQPRPQPPLEQKLRLHRRRPRRLRPLLLRLLRAPRGGGGGGACGLERGLGLGQLALGHLHLLVGRLGAVQQRLVKGCSTCKGM